MVISLKDHWYGVTSAPPPKGGKVEIKHAFFEPLPTSIVFTLQNVGAENGGQLSTLDSAQILLLSFEKEMQNS